MKSRLLFIIFFALLVNNSFCQEKKDAGIALTVENIAGRWIMEQTDSVWNHRMLEEVTLTKDKKIMIRSFVDGTITDEYQGTYRIDSDTIVMMYNTKPQKIWIKSLTAETIRLVFNDKEELQFSRAK